MMKENKEMAESRFDKYVLRGAKVSIPVFPEKALLNIGFDQKYMERFGKVDINFNFVSILSPHVLADPPHTHNCDEYLFFIPARELAGTRRRAEKARERSGKSKQ
jgi:hypothetical protein